MYLRSELGLVSFANRRGHTQLATEGSWWLVVRNWLMVVLRLVTLVVLKLVVLQAWYGEWLIGVVG